MTPLNMATGPAFVIIAVWLAGFFPSCSSSMVPGVAFASRTPRVIPSASPSAAPVSTQSPTSGGIVVIAIPTPAPLVCSPAPVTVPVDQTVILTCTSQGYDGPFTWTLSDPTVASVDLAAGTLNFFYINGIKSGSTTLSFQFSVNGTGSVEITVP